MAKKKREPVSVMLQSTGEGRNAYISDSSSLGVDIDDLLGGLSVELVDFLSDRRAERLGVVVAGLVGDSSVLVDLLGLADDLGDERVDDLLGFGRTRGELGVSLGMSAGWVISLLTSSAPVQQPSRPPWRQGS